MSRVGLIAKKVGCSAIFNADGERMAVTLLHVGSCQVVAHKTKERDGYIAVQIGAFDANPNRISKQLKGHFSKANVAPKKKVVEFRVNENALIEVGVTLGVDHFVEGQYIDITGINIGKGFAGVMKRHNFRGLEASHGVSVSHRSHGSTGQRQDPGKVFKGKKMAGHMGDHTVTIQSVKILAVDTANGLIAVYGSVPGATNSYVVIKDAIKKALPANAPFPFLKAESNAAPVDATTEVLG